MPIRRIGRPGLIGLAARTAVIAGTASAVSGGMANARQRRTQAEYEQQQYVAAQQQARADAAARDAAAQNTAPAAAQGDNIAAQLQQLSSLMQSGVLSADEFAAAKAKLLS